MMRDLTRKLFLDTQHHVKIVSESSVSSASSRVLIHISGIAIDNRRTAFGNKTTYQIQFDSQA